MADSLCCAPHVGNALRLSPGRYLAQITFTYRDPALYSLLFPPTDLERDVDFTGEFGHRDRQISLSHVSHHKRGLSKVIELLGDSRMI